MMYVFLFDACGRYAWMWACVLVRRRGSVSGTRAQKQKAAERGTGRLYVGVVMVRLVASVFSGGWRRSVGGGKGTA